MAKKTTTRKKPKASSTPTDRKYKRNFLKQVIARADFLAPIPIPEGPLPKPILAVAKKQFPASEQKKELLKQMSVSSAGIREMQIEQFEWFYHNNAKTKTLRVAQNYMYVEYLKYDSFDALRNDFLSVMNALFDYTPPLQLKRLGLRYIDHIELKEPKPTEWSTYLSPNVLGSFALADDPSTISRAFHHMQFDYGDMRLRFQYGMPNSDFPAVIKKKLFVLDFDAFRDGEVSRSELEPLLIRCHEKIKAAFEEVITDGLRKKMGVVSG